MTINETTELPGAESQSHENPLLYAALDYAERGWFVLPLHSVARNGCSCGSAACPSPGKHPRTLHGVKDATDDQSQILEWWLQWPDANIGIQTGAASNLVVLDVDSAEAMNHLRSSIGQLPETATVVTGRGKHFYFAHPGGSIRSRTGLILGVDLRGDDAYVVAPPSIHASGTEYTFEKPAQPLAPMPDWLVKPPAISAVAPPASGESVFREGERNSRLAGITGSLIRHDIRGKALDMMLETANEEVCEPPLDQREVRQIARSIERAEQRREHMNASHDVGIVTQGGNGRFRLFSIDDVLNEPSPEWRVEGLLPVGALSMIYAPQAQFKTFFALDLALSVAHNVPFHGRNVKRGPVVYILGEGRGGLGNRIEAWRCEHPTIGQALLTEDRSNQAFFVLEAVQFKQRRDVEDLRTQIDRLNVKPAMVFIDTFARSAVGLDENDAMQIGLWIDAVTALQHDMAIDVVAIHHAQKGKSARPRERGSSAFIGAVDTVIRLERKPKTGTRIIVTCEKQKDAEEFPSFALLIKVISLGTNEHGNAVSSCALALTDTVQGEADTTDDRFLNESEVFALQALGMLGSAGSGDWRNGISLLKGDEVAPKTFDNWRKRLIEMEMVEQVGEGTHIYRGTVNGEAVANSVPLAR